MFKKAWRKRLSDLEFATNDAEATEAIEALIKLIYENGVEIPEGVRKMDLDQVYKTVKGKLGKDKAGSKEGEDVKAAATSEVDVMTVAENAAREEKANANTAEELADLKCSANGTDHFDRGLEQAGGGEAEGGAGS